MTRTRPTSQLDLLIGKSVTVLSGEYLSEVKGFQWHCAKQAIKTPVVLPNGQLKNIELVPAQWVSWYQFCASRATVERTGQHAQVFNRIIATCCTNKTGATRRCQPKRVYLAGI